MSQGRNPQVTRVPTRMEDRMKKSSRKHKRMRAAIAHFVGHAPPLKMIVNYESGADVDALLNFIGASPSGLPFTWMTLTSVVDAARIMATSAEEIEPDEGTKAPSTEPTEQQADEEFLSKLESALAQHLSADVSSDDWTSPNSRLLRISFNGRVIVTDRFDVSDKPEYDG